MFGKILGSPIFRRRRASLVGQSFVEPLEGRRLLSGTVTTLATFSAADGFNPDTLAQGRGGGGADGRSEEGLSADEASALENYRHIGRLLESMKSKARQSLSNAPT